MGSRRRPHRRAPLRGTAAGNKKYHIVPKEYRIDSKGTFSRTRSFHIVSKVYRISFKGISS
eukprot:6889528-Heterocapsa_arctica.AAC.1